MDTKRISWLPEERWADEFNRIIAEFTSLRLRAQKGYFDYASNGFDANEWKDWLRMEADSPDGFDFSMVSPALDREARAVAEEHGANKMYAVSLMMFATSVLAGRYTGVRVQRMGKFLRLMLYVMNIAPPGSAKTGIKDLFVKKLVELHGQLHDEFSELRLRWDDAKKNKEASRYQRETRESYGDLYREALSLRLQLQGALAPDLRANLEGELSKLEERLALSTFEVVERRDKAVVWLSNVTMPRILSAAAASNAIGLIYDDVNVFISNFGIGSKQKGEDDSSYLTSMHSGEPVNMERQGEDNSYYCTDPCVCIFINAQARMLKFLLEKSFIDSGLTYRFIPVIESDAVAEAPEGFDEDHDYFTDEIRDFDALVRAAKTDIEPHEFYAMCDRMILHLYTNPEYSSGHRNEYNFTPQAEAVREVVRKMLKTIGAAFKTNRWEKHTSMVSKMHEMTDKFALIFQIMHDFSQPAPVRMSPGDVLFDSAKPNPHANRTVGAWAVHAGFQFSRLVLDSWMQLPKRANVEDDEMTTLLKDQGKTRGGAPSKDYALLWCYLAKQLAKGGVPGDPTFAEEDGGPEFPRAMLDGIVRQSNGFDPKAAARMLRDGNKSMDHNGGKGGPAAATKFRLLVPAFGGAPVDMPHVDEFIAERLSAYQERLAAKNERAKKCEA